MKLKYLGAAIATAAIAIFSSQASASSVDKSWGRATLSYLNYDCIGGSCRLYGNIQDKAVDGLCVKIRVYQQYGWNDYSRTCTGSLIGYDIYAPASLGQVNLVQLYWEGNDAATLWQRP